MKCPICGGSMWVDDDLHWQWCKNDAGYKGYAQTVTAGTMMLWMITSKQLTIAMRGVKCDLTKMDVSDRNFEVIPCGNQQTEGF